MKFSDYTILILFTILIQACTTSPSNSANIQEITVQQEKQVVTIRLSDFKGKSPNCTIETRLDTGVDVILSEDKTWIEYHVEIKQAGRYIFQLDGKAINKTAIVWMEDYVDNPDDRTYNITGNIEFSSNAQEMNKYNIDGSPLNAGLHKMRLHVSGENISLSKVQLILLKPYVKTPQILTQKMVGDSLSLVWSDEFTDGTTPDASKWTFDVGNWGWGNNELQYYTENRPENARIEDGNLIIEARKDDNGRPWTSARLTTRGKTAFIYGRIEFRAKVPPNKGNWAAGWTLGDSYVDELSWPYCGEIDILESVGYEMDNDTGNGKAHASAHCGAYYFKLENQPTGIIEVKNMHETYHTYAVDWTPEGIIAYVDDIEYFRYEDTSNELTWPFDKAQNIILNLAMGGGWGGLQGMDETVDSQKMIIDYVRVYEKI